MADDGGIWMSDKGAVGYEIITDYLAGKFTRSEASAMLEVTHRTVTRMASRVRKKGLAGMLHGNRGRSPWSKTPLDLKTRVMCVMKEKYSDFNLVHALEMLQEQHGLTVAYSTFRRWCHEKGIVKRAKRRRGVARRLRERMPSEGLLLQMDGSHHQWNRRDVWTLIAAIDDATSEIPYAEFFAGETTLASMKVVRNIIDLKGIPFALYVDKAGCFGGPKRQGFNQFKRACKEIGIRVLFASSAEAKGRIERAWDTFQDRLVPELRLYDITKMAAANEYVREKFLPNYWERKCRVEPRNPESKYRPIPKHVDLNEIFCLKYRRRVNGDHTVQWRAETYALRWPKDRSIRGHQIEFRVYSDGSWKAFHADDPLALNPVLKPVKVATATTRRAVVKNIGNSHSIPKAALGKNHHHTKQGTAMA
jgi:transposase